MRRIMGFILGYIRIMENEMETTVVHWGYIGNNGKEHGNYYWGFSEQNGTVVLTSYQP